MRGILASFAALVVVVLGFTALRLTHVTHGVHHVQARAPVAAKSQETLLMTEGTLPTTDTPTQSDRARLRLLDDVLASRNDNDPRLDRELNELPSSTRRLFRERYKALAAEKRNERGTIVFLLGRKLEQEEDLAFLEEVLSEKPCLSLMDCAREGRIGEAAEGGVGHASLATEELALAYPQIMALKSLELFLTTGEGPRELVERARECVRKGRDSQVPIVSRMAAEIARRLGGGGNAR